MRLLRIGQWVAEHLPVPVGNFIADRAGELSYMLAKRSRCAAESNMRHVLPPGTAQRKINSTVRQVFRNLARNYYDLLRAQNMTNEQIDRIVELDEAGFKHVQKVLDEHKGMVMVSAHYGAFDMASQVLGRRGLPLLLMVARTKPLVVSEFLTRLRLDRGLREANLENGLGAIKKAMQALREGDMVALFADRNVDGNGVTIPFFGAPAVMATGVAKMSIRSKAPVVGAFCHRHGNRYVVKFDAPIYPPKVDNEENVRQFTREVFAVYEKHIGRHPEQWVLMQPVWRDSQCAEEPAAPAAAA